MHRAVRLQINRVIRRTLLWGSLFFVAAAMPAAVSAQEEVGLTSAFSDLYLRRHLDDRKIALHGYTSFKYFDQEGENGTFDQHIFEPFFGYQLNDRVFAKLVIEFEHAPESQGSNVFAEIFIEQAEVDITLRDGTTVGFGAIIVPFGLENYLHAPPDNRLVTRPPIAKGEHAIIRSTWTDVGIQLTHAVEGLGTVDLYVINGSAAQEKESRGRDTEGPNANAGKSVGAELQVTQPFPGANVGLSGVIGPHDKTDELDSWRLGIHALINRGQTYFRGEYLFGTDEGLGDGAVFAQDEKGDETSELQAPGKDRDVSGFYLILSQTLPIAVLEDRLDANLRYSEWTADDSQDLKFSELALGLRYRPFQHTFFKAEQRFNKEKGRAERKADDLFSLQLTVLF